MSNYYLNRMSYGISDKGEYFAPNDITPTDKYHDREGLELVSEDGDIYPFDVLFSGRLAQFETITGLGAYKELMISNQTGAPIAYRANGTGTSISLPDGTIIVEKLKDAWDTIDVTGQGTAYIHIVGYK